LTPGQLYFPLDLSVFSPRPDDPVVSELLLAVIDRSYRIQFFDFQGSFIHKIKVTFTPVLITSGKQGILYILDDKGVLYTLAGVTAYPIRHDPNISLGKTSDCVYLADRNALLVSDHRNRVRLIELADGNTQEFGRSGFDAGQFYFPNGLDMIDHDRFAVVDLFSARIQVFSLAGSFLGQWQTQGDGLFQSVNPVKIVVSSSGMMYLSDKYHHRVLGLVIPQ